MKRGTLLGIWAAMIALTGISFLFDLQISQFFILLRTPLLTQVLLGLAFFTSTIILFFFLTSIFLWREHKRRWILPLWLTLGATVLLVFIMKLLIARERPFLAYPDGISALIIEMAYRSWDTAFPSSHAAVVFSAIPLLDKEFPKFKYAWFAFAAIVALSRVYFGVHFFSDIMAGALIGYSIGWLIVKAEEKYGFGKKIGKKIGIV